MAFQPPQENNVLPPVVMRDFSAGIHTNISSGLANPNTLKYSINMFNDPTHSKIGTLTSRRGIENLFGYIDADIAGVDPEDEICGLYGYDFFGIGVLIVAVDEIGGSVKTYAYNQSTDIWEDIGPAPFAWTANRIVRFETMFEYIFACNGTSFKSWDADTANNWGSTHLTGAASSVNLIKKFQGRLYVSRDITAGAGGGWSGVLYSSLPTSPTGTITWDNSVNYISFKTQFDDNITALEVNGNLLLVFFQRSIFTWDGANTQTDPLYRVGAVSQEVVQTIGSTTLFLSQGTDHFSVYRFDGDQPVDISYPIRQFLKTSNLLSGVGVPAEFGSWKDEKNYYLSISNVTIDGETLNNIVLCYSVIDNSWTQLSIKNKSGTFNNFFRFSTSYTLPFTSSSVIFGDLIGGLQKHYTVLGGTSLGTTSTSNIGISPVLWNYSTNKTDNVGDATTNPIEILLQTHELEFGSRATIKQLNKFFIYASGNYGIIDVAVRIDGGNWIDLGKLSDKTTEFELATQGHYFEFRLSGSNTGEQFVFEGFEFPSITVEPYET